VLADGMVVNLNADIAEGWAPTTSATTPI